MNSESHGNNERKRNDESPDSHHSHSSHRSHRPTARPIGTITCWDDIAGNDRLKQHFKFMIRELRIRKSKIQRQNILLLGESRAGKTSITEWFIRCLHCRQIPMMNFEWKKTGLDEIAQQYQLPVTTTKSGFKIIPLDSVERILMVAHEKLQELEAIR